MAFGRDDVEAAEFADAFAQFDVGTATGHVGGDGHGAELAGHRDDVGFGLVVLGVEDLVRDLGHREHATEGLGGFDGGGADEHGLAALMGFGDLLDGELVLLLTGLEDDVVVVDADARTVRRDGDDGQAVDVVELGSLGLGGAGHARELLVHAEVVLDRDRRVGLVLLLERDAFLGFDGLVEAVGPAATFHDAAGVFVDDLHLALMDDVLLVLFVQRVGLEQLADGVDIFGSLGVSGFSLGAEFGAAFVGQRFIAVELDVAGR